MAAPREGEFVLTRPRAAVLNFLAPFTIGLAALAVLVSFSVHASAAEPDTYAPAPGIGKPTVPFEVSLASLNEGAPLARVVVHPEQSGVVAVTARNEDTGLRRSAPGIAVASGQTVTRAIPLPVTGADSVVDLDVTLVTDDGVRYGKPLRVRAVATPGGYALEELPIIEVPDTEFATAEQRSVTTPSPATGAHALKPGGARAATGPSANAVGGTVTVTGQWGYLAQDGLTFVQLSYARIEIWESDGTTGQLIGTTYADVDGVFTVDVGNVDEDGGVDLFVRVFSADDFAVRVTTTAGATYNAQTPVFEDTQDGVLDVGAWQVTGDLRMAFYIYDIITFDAWWYLFTAVGWQNDQNLRVNWPNTLTGSLAGTYFNLASDQVFLSAGDRWDSDVILHEYGHFVMDQLWPSYPLSPNCGPHSPGINSSEGCAWTEGWATFLQAAIQNDPVYTDLEDASLSFDHENAPASWDDPRDEGSVGASLWDIFDAANEPHDLLDDGLDGPATNGIWNASAVTGSVDVFDFWSDWQSQNARATCEVAGILVEHGIAAELCDDTPPTDPTDLTSPSHSIGIPSSDDTIEVNWPAVDTVGGASDDISGVDGYSWAFTQGEADLPDETKDGEESTLAATSPALSDGDWWFHIRTVDNAGNWTSTQHFGPFTVSPVIAQPPTIGAVTPSSGAVIVGAPTLFEATFSDPNGAADIAWGVLWLTADGGLANDCAVIWLGGQVALFADDGSTLLFAGVPGAGNGVANSQCQLDATTSTVQTTDNDVAVGFSVTLLPGFEGDRFLVGLASDSGGLQGSSVRGPVAVGPPFPVEALEVTPNTGSVPTGTPTTFTVDFEDLDGGADIQWALVSITPSGGLGGGMHGVVGSWSATVAGRPCGELPVRGSARNTRHRVQ